jgi:hypothetical protein
MTDQALNVLKLILLGLLYLFFARVLWAVWSEVRVPRGRTVEQAAVAGQRAAATQAAPRPPVPAAPASDKKQAKSKKGKKGKAAQRLVILEPRHRRGTSISLGNEITLGRDPNCTITIDDDSFVSQLHFRIYDYDGQPMVEDLGSTNGTYHNGNRLHGARLLHPGDRIQVGITVIEAQ